MFAAMGDGINIEFQNGFIAFLSESIGVPDEAIRLLITTLACYPIAAIYRCLNEKFESKPLHHSFFAISGFLLCMFNFGVDFYHSLVAILVTYLLMRMLHRKPKQLVIINFSFHMAYLLIAYYFTASNEYDILWTMPHCVLVLRMIGIGFDVVDGQMPREKLSKDQLETALEEMPTLLELIGFGYFPCSFLVGPQFPFRRYKRFINGEFKPYTGATKAGLVRMLLGFLYLAVRQIGSTILPDGYFLTDDYQNEPFIWRIIYMGIWGKLALYKYISVWLLTEGSLMCIGISYAGKTSDGVDDWSGCHNVKLILLETGNTMGHYVQSFNVNTNQWLAQYVYKRLKFLNNRNISYAAALGFLAVWHGFHSGYYMSFFIEFITVSTEKQIEDVYEKAVIRKYGSILNASLVYKFLEFMVLKAYNIFFIGWCFVPFTFLGYSRWIRVLSAVHYFGFVFVGIAFIVCQLYKSTVKQSRESSTTAAAVQQHPVTDGQNKED